jgi:catechol 2,3-dioxygenase-like lactoylglutathione lyase family enzyme
VIVNGAHHTGFSVLDLDESIDFYSLLGCEVIWRREIADEYFGKIVGIENCVVLGAQLRIPNSAHVIELFQYMPHQAATNLVPNQPGHSHIAFLVDDLPSTVAELEASGIRFKSQPILITAGVNAGASGVYALDPNGITIEFFQPARHLPDARPTRPD